MLRGPFGEVLTHHEPGHVVYRIGRRHLPGGTTDDRDELHLPVHGLGRQRHGADRSGERGGELGEDDRSRRALESGLLSVGVVVEPDREDLTRQRHRGSQLCHVQAVDLCGVEVEPGCPGMDVVQPLPDQGRLGRKVAAGALTQVDTPAIDDEHHAIVQIGESHRNPPRGVSTCADLGSLVRCDAPHIERSTASTPTPLAQSSTSNDVSTAGWSAASWDGGHRRPGRPGTGRDCGV